jgi:hypothetical protein
MMKFAKRWSKTHESKIASKYHRKSQKKKNAGNKRMNNKITQILKPGGHKGVRASIPIKVLAQILIPKLEKLEST